MKRLLAAALCAATILPASPATADDSPGCVTLYEGRIVEAGWSKTYTEHHFGTHGQRIRRTDDRLVKTYPRCNRRAEDVVVVYRIWWGAWAVAEVRGVRGWGEA